MKQFSRFAALFALILMSSLAFAQDDMTYTVNMGGNADLGVFLTDADGMTLYVFTNDEAGVSSCAGDCAAAWPPLTVGDGEMASIAPELSGVVRTIAREDGSAQVTYNGMPLYYWQDDANPGDTNGHTLGDVWFVASMPDVGLSGNADLGSFLVDANGMTLYTFDNDEAGASNCTGDCATAWPPLTIEDADSMAAQPWLMGEFGAIEREDGTMQVTYNDAPLYFWQDDAQPGDATGHTLGDVWFVATAPAVNVVEHEEFGEILTGATGLTLYTFSNDEAGVSNCVDGCAAAWPPATVVDVDGMSIMGEAGGEFGAIERADGSMQITYNDAPLYYWMNDVVAGDTTGHNIGDVWFVAQP